MGGGYIGCIPSSHTHSSTFSPSHAHNSTLSYPQFRSFTHNSTFSPSHAHNSTLLHPQFHFFTPKIPPSHTRNSKVSPIIFTHHAPPQIYSSTHHHHSYTLLVGKPPFETSNLRDTYARIKKNEYHIPSDRTSPQARNLIQRLLQAHPDARPTMREVINDEFFRCGACGGLGCLRVWGV